MADLATRQYGVVGRRQLLAMGVSEDGIQGWLGAGRLHLFLPGVYALGHRHLAREAWWLGAVLSSGDGAVLSHRSAAALWGMRTSSARIVDVTVTPKSRSWGRIRRHCSLVSPDERAVKGAIPITTFPRTVIDVAGSESVDVVTQMIRQAEYLRLDDTLSLWSLIDRYPGRRGVARVRVALEALGSQPVGHTESPLEDRFLAFLRRHRLPLPRLNDWLVLGADRYRVDCHWPGVRQVVELDGWQAHGTRAAFQGDRARDRALRAAGYPVTRITWHQLEREPEAVAADLRRLLQVSSVL